MKKSALNKANNLIKTGEFLKAEIKLKKILAKRAENEGALHGLSLIALHYSKYDEAAYFCAKAISLNPKFSEALNTMGNIYYKQKALDKAAAFYREAVKHKPNFAVAYNNLATAFHDNGDLQAAIDTYELAISIDPSYISAHVNKANTFHDMHQFESAIQYYEKAISIDPENQSAHFNLSTTLLLIGQFSSGWRELKWMLNKSEFNNGYKQLSGKLWNNESLINKSIVIYGAEGVGDEIMYMTFLNKIIEGAKEVTVVCQSRLLPIFSLSFPGVNFIQKNVNMLHLLSKCPFDYKIPAAFLPSNFIKTVSDFPLPPRFLAHLNEKRLTLRTKYFAGDNSKPIIGIAWKSLDASTGENRSICLIKFFNTIGKTLANDFHFVSLQYGEVFSEIEKVRNSTTCEIYVDEDIDQFDSITEFSAQVSACDYVISIDNTTLHMAGALGIETFALIPSLPDWRWFTKTNKCYWYKSVHLYRQETKTCWLSAFNEIVNKLSEIRENKI